MLAQESMNNQFVFTIKLCQKMTKLSITLTFAFLFCFTTPLLALKCYVCFTSKLGCDKNETTNETCPDDQKYCFSRNIEYPQSGDSKTIKGCTSFGPKCLETDSSRRTYLSTENRCMLCETDLCNSANSALIKTSIIITISMIVFAEINRIIL